MKKRKPLVSSDRESFEISENQAIGTCVTEEVRELEKEFEEMVVKLETAKTIFTEINRCCAIEEVFQLSASAINQLK